MFAGDLKLVLKACNGGIELPTRFGMCSRVFRAYGGSFPAYGISFRAYGGSFHAYGISFPAYGGSFRAYVGSFRACGGSFRANGGSFRANGGSFPAHLFTRRCGFLAHRLEQAFQLVVGHRDIVLR